MCHVTFKGSVCDVTRVSLKSASVTFLCGLTASLRIGFAVFIHLLDKNKHLLQSHLCSFVDTLLYTVHLRMSKTTEAVPSQE